jgi:hypothetical protein
VTHVTAKAFTFTLNRNIEGGVRQAYAELTGAIDRKSHVYSFHAPITARLQPL